MSTIDRSAIEARLQAHLSNPKVRPVVPAVFCADGFSLSIQAGEFHYCEPREDRGPWWGVEVGFPSGPVPTLADWKEDFGGTPDEKAVYGYVPIARVVDVIASHGGFAA